MSKANLFYAQSGGVTAVINASACGVIETARKHKDRIGKVYAGLNGIVGALHEELIDTNKESAKAIAALRSTPAGAFGSCRYKLQSFEENAREYERLMEAISYTTVAAIRRTPQINLRSYPSTKAILSPASAYLRPSTMTFPSQTTVRVSAPLQNT